MSDNRAEAKVWKNEHKWQVELYVPEEQTSVAVVNSKKEAMHILFDWIRDLTHVDFVVYTGTGRQEFVGTKLNNHVRRFT